jgi:hypothetical protein
MKRDWKGEVRAWTTWRKAYREEQKNASRAKGSVIWT